MTLPPTARSNEEEDGVVLVLEDDCAGMTTVKGDLLLLEMCGGVEVLVEAAAAKVGGVETPCKTP